MRFFENTIEILVALAPIIASISFFFMFNKKKEKKISK